MKAHTIPAEGADAGVDLTGLDPARARDWLGRMLLIREFESTAGPLATSGAIPGGMHAATGQEAVAVGVTSVLGPDADLAKAREFLRTALGGNSRATLGFAKTYAEERR